MTRIYIVIISFFALFISSCTRQSKQTTERTFLTTKDSIAASDEDAIMGLIRQKVDGSSICSINLTTKVSDIKTRFKLKPKVTGSTHPTIAYERFNNKRMTWGLSLLLKKPFGTDPLETPSQITLEIALTEQALSIKETIKKDIAQLFDAQPDVWKECQDYWFLVSGNMNNIFVTVSKTKGEEQGEETDDNTFDFS